MTRPQKCKCCSIALTRDLFSGKANDECSYALPGIYLSDKFCSSLREYPELNLMVAAKLLVPKLFESL